MSDETDYEALEKSVKYISWKGAQDFFGLGNDTWISWHTGRTGESTKWLNSQEAGNFDWHDVK